MEAARGGKPPKSFVDELRDYRMAECLKAIEQDPNLCLWYEDLENLIPCVITHEQRSKLMEMFNPVPFDFDKYPAGKIIVFGTGGQMEKGVDWENFWKQHDEPDEKTL